MPRRRIIRRESIFRKPVFICLSVEMAHQKADFFAIDRFIQVDKEVRYAKIAVIFRNFIFQDEVISKGIPGQLTDQTMVLMQIMPVMGEDDVWRFTPFSTAQKNL